MRIVKCMKCGLVYVDLVPAIDINIYNDVSYIAYWDKSIYVEREAVERLSLISRYKGSGKLLDIGCGIGIFLSEAKKVGWDAQGTEVSKYAINFVKEKHNLEVCEGSLKDIGFPAKFFDVITLWHVLEHLLNPIDELKEINRILKDDGILCIEVPNVGSLDALVRRRNWICFGPGHNYHFSKTTLKLAGEVAGFESLLVKCISGYKRCKYRHSISKKLIHCILTSINMGNRLFCIFAKEKR
ncbi:MAG: class I SAM-dependent methyltransferase [Candidatus Stahlbacteria bacterium]|nr:class I SAM-dependent methyltransferase [Candidatus Stahlbacteria bacterium]